MDDKLQRFLLKLVVFLLKAGALAYLFATLFPYLQEPGFQNTFGNWTLRWFLVILLASAALMVFVINRNDFLVYGFFFIFMAAMFNMFLVLVNPSPIPGVFNHFFVATISVYFMTRTMRKDTSSTRKHRRSKSTK